MRQKLLPKTHPKTNLLLAGNGRLYEKRRKIRLCEQARPSIFRPFFCAFHALDHALRDRPAVHYCVVSPAGGAVFPAGKTSRKSNALVNQAAVRTATPSGFAKQTEKAGEDQRIELARIPEILRLFHTDCRGSSAANNHARLVFCFSFDSKEKRPPPSLAITPSNVRDRGSHTPQNTVPPRESTFPHTSAPATHPSAHVPA